MSVGGKKRRTFSLAEKLDIIKHVDSNPGKTRAAIARDLEIPVTTLNLIVSSREKIINECSTHSSTVKKIRVGKNEEVNEKLLEWFRQVRSQNVPVNGTILREKATEIALRLGVDDFSPSNGWIDRFKKRTGIVYRSVSGEAASVDESVTDDWQTTKLPFLLHDYAARDIFNLDECGLFFNLMPDKTFSFKGEKCIGGKRSKERITILLGANMDGSEKLPPLAIGKSAKPRCFKNTKTLPCRYESNKNAWMTSKIFLQYLNFLDAKMGVQNRKIILFMDHCSAHPTDTGTLRNICVKFLPPNTTSCLQPMDQGIIKNFKHHFRARLCKRLLRDIEAKKPVKKISLLTALHMTAASWASMPQSVIANCFRKAGFKHAAESATTSESATSGVASTGDEPDKLLLADEWVALQEKMNFTSTFEEYASVDDAAVPCHALTVEEMCAPTESLEQESEDDEDEEPPVKVTCAQAHESLDILKNFIAAQSDIPEYVMQSLFHLDHFLVKSGNTQLKQSTIQDFFKK